MPTIAVRDLQMHYTERGEGPTVLVLHPATADGRMIGWLAQAITRLGFNTVTPDLRGHGQTANPAPDMHLPRMVDDLLELGYVLGRTPLHAAGYSMGGAVALYAARKRPELFRSLVILGTASGGTDQDRLLRVLGGTLAGQPPVVQAVFDPERGTGVGWDAPPEAFSGITCPMLIIGADRDEFNDPEEHVALYRAMPNAELLIVPHCDHLGLVRHPAVMEAVQSFYRRVPR